MSTARVKVSEDDGLDALLRAPLVDAWLAEHQADFGRLDEDELAALAAEAGVPYIPPARPGTVA